MDIDGIEYLVLMWMCVVTEWLMLAHDVYVCRKEWTENLIFPVFSTVFAMVFTLALLQPLF